MGFYKKEDNQILVGENFVYSPVVTLKAEEKDNYTYPQDGWYWFDTFDEALVFFSKMVNVTVVSVTPRQIRLKLLELGLLDTINNMLEQNAAWKIEWEYATEVLRNSPLISGLASELGLSDEAIDALFIEASTL